uniref:LAGLIDADG homing endonuclease n=1 Tax=Romanomermis culicivorax TaxID=13658 RepID=A0A915I4K3_ROMCU
MYGSEAIQYLESNRRLNRRALDTTTVGCGINNATATFFYKIKFGRYEKWFREKVGIEVAFTENPYKVFSTFINALISKEYDFDE